ncbi:MAG TPA: DNA polymerase, partial [Acidimicrobiales bacterium]
GRVWAALHDLPLDAVPRAQPVDLFHQPDDGDGDAVRPDGHLDADWAAGGWAESPARAQRWAALALDAAGKQAERLAALAAGTHAGAGTSTGIGTGTGTGIGTGIGGHVGGGTGTRAGGGTGTPHTGTGTDAGGGTGTDAGGGTRTGTGTGGHAGTSTGTGIGTGAGTSTGTGTHAAGGTGSHAGGGTGSHAGGRADGGARPLAPATARVESTAELLCVELSHDGLPVDRAVAEALLADIVGPRPRSEAEAQRQRAERDAEVLRHAPDGTWVDLRSPGQVKSLLRRVGIEVPDTRAWRLETLRDEHPLVDALLTWRKAERVATTYGYAWLDEHVGEDGRLRGSWTGSDGAAGRMTASAGLHNLLADMRRAVVAEPGHVFVRADLGQIEPRVLAAVSGDRALARAAQADDLYPPLAEHLGVDRATAKVAMLGAMYGQTSGHGAQVQRRLRSAYPVAMAYLEDGDRAGRAGRDVRTYGGRLVRLGGGAPVDPDDRARAGARGRYGRNALVQGAAAELFKMWAVTVRARAADLGARIVLCLHDELLVHAPVEHGDAVATLVDRCLQEAASRWAPGTPVRFVADIQVIPTWAAAKE